MLYLVIKNEIFMSRIGKLPIKVPANIQVEIENEIINIVGPYGKLKRNFSSLLSVELKNQIIFITKKNNNRITNQLYGLTRTLINNMIIGVSEKFEKVLLLEGVGYRAQTLNNELVLNLGYSHPIIIPIPIEIEIIIEKNIIIIVKGSDKELVGQLSATIKSKRPPEPYKGKGVLYQGEVIKRKVGKSGK